MKLPDAIISKKKKKKPLEEGREKNACNLSHILNFFFGNQRK